MSVYTPEQIRAGLTPAAPSLEQCEAVVRLREDRLRRARAKFDGALDEKVAALIGLCHAKAARSAFIAGQTDPQLRML